MEKFITAHPYFGGATFSAADIMYDIVMTIIDNLQVDHAVYPNLLAWHERVKARPAYQRAMQAGNPDGVVLKVPIPKAAASAAPAAAPAVATGHYTAAATTIGVLLADPVTKSSSVTSGMANSMTMKALQAFKPDLFNDANLAALDADLARLPVK
jgi:hypothetical protein